MHHEKRSIRELNELRKEKKNDRNIIKIIGKEENTDNNIEFNIEENKEIPDGSEIKDDTRRREREVEINKTNEESNKLRKLHKRGRMFRQERNRITPESGIISY